MKHSTPVLAAVRSMHRDDDNHPGRNPYNTVRPLDVVAWTPPVSASECVTMWTDENGLDCYTNELTLEDKS